jgi:tetratricopeptide (TPR) repeat protein
MKLSLVELVSLQQQGKVDAAIAGYQAFLKQQSNADALANLGVALRTKGHIQAAIICYRRALALEANNVSVLSNLGGGLRALGELDEALEVLVSALAIDPDFTAAHYNLGLVYMDSQRPVDAIACFEEVLKCDPNRSDARFDRATCILQSGDLLRGFAEYECRFAYEPRLQRAYTQPRWNGESLSGKTLLIYAEQGFGDTLQFSRYLPLIKKAGGQLILECPLPLKRLMQSSFDCLALVVTPEENSVSFDYHIPLLSLPAFFETTLKTIPKTTPYLKSRASQLSRKSAESLKIGLVWGNGHKDVGTRSREIALKEFAPLLVAPHISFYSFQKGKQSQQLKEDGFDSLITDLGSSIKDFADSASLLAQMDLLISVDTAIVHCAGALGIPCWVLLPFGSEWRWLLDRVDSPWYPSLTLYQQDCQQPWSELIARVAENLNLKHSFQDNFTPNLLFANEAF